MYCVMNSKKQLSNTKASTGPVPSHKNNAVVVVDFFAKAKMPRHVADICQNESILDASMIQLSATTAGGHEENVSVLDSFLAYFLAKFFAGQPVICCEWCSNFSKQNNHCFCTMIYDYPMTMTNLACKQISFSVSFFLLFYDYD